MMRIRRGLIVRQPCEVCQGQKAQAHHDDYSKPFNIRWLCQTRHTAVHLEMRLALKEREAMFHESHFFPC